MNVIASIPDVKRIIGAKRRKASDNTLNAKVYILKCVQHRDIRFPIDRATKTHV